ncbi:VanZ family protein [Streptomyces sp. NBC_00876]|uniref:VanZ family protein n=1 Tax=Streptomyces sp. NBC_00876 TaxID=2975853 RepID=UPI003863549A|nr:VanZ family protein [Streptomyces sp. NBC_00876]
MFQAIFQGKGEFVALLALVSAALAFIVFVWRKNRQAPALIPAAFTLCLAIVLGVTLFLSGSGEASRECTLNHQIWEPFRTTQGLLNGLMTVPLGFLGLLASRRRLLTITGVVLGPCVVEVAQASVNAFSRLCDSSDAEMNILGGLLGVALAWLVARARCLELKPVLKERTPTAVAALAGVAVIVVAASNITFTAVDATSVQSGSNQQADAMRDALVEAFGDKFKNMGDGRLQYSPDPGLRRGAVHFSSPKVDADLSWPSKLNLSAMFEWSDKPTSRSISIDGREHPRMDLAEARKLATQYAKDHYPWVSTANHVTAVPVADGKLGWMVSWRVLDHGVLMPAMLDVQINTAGRISQLLVSRGPAHLSGLPSIKVTRTQAISIAKNSMAHTEELDFHANVLKASLRDGHWNPEYIVQAIVRGSKDESTSETYVDAHTGQLHKDASG